MTKVKVFDCNRDELQSKLDEHYADGYTLTSLVQTSGYYFTLVMTKNMQLENYPPLKKRTEAS